MSRGRQPGNRGRLGSLAFAVVVAAVVATGCGATTAAVPTTATLNPASPNGANGWYRTTPVMALAGTNPGSGASILQYSMDGGATWTTYTAPVTLGETGGATVTYRATDIWGLPTPVGTFTYKSDRTNPVVTYTGNAGWYFTYQPVSIGCTPSDTLSGIASHTCRTIQRDAFSLGVGTYAFSATANDNAGNVGTGTVSYSVGVFDPIFIIPFIPIIPILPPIIIGQ